MRGFSKLTMTDLPAFVRESNKIEGIVRDPTQAEIDAHKELVELDYIQVQDLEKFVSIVQPGAVLRLRDGCNVRVGNYTPPHGGQHILYLLQELLEKLNTGKMNSYQGHIEYEKIHPFSDGNGRSGRALWLWRKGYAGTRLGFLHEFYYQTLDKANND